MIWRCRDEAAAFSSHGTAGGHKEERLHPPAQHVGSRMEAPAWLGGADETVDSFTVGLDWAVTRVQPHRDLRVFSFDRPSQTHNGSHMT